MSVVHSYGFKKENLKPFSTLFPTKLGLLRYLSSFEKIDKIFVDVIRLCFKPSEAQTFPSEYRKLMPTNVESLNCILFQCWAIRRTGTGQCSGGVQRIKLIFASPNALLSARKICVLCTISDSLVIKNIED